MNILIEDEIIEICESYQEETIDIAVSDDNLFFANDILTHNSGYGDAAPALDSASESMAIPNTADIYITIWQKEEDRELGVIHFTIRKSRQGARDVTNTFRIDYSTLTIYEDSTLNITEESSQTERVMQALAEN